MKLLRIYSNKKKKVKYYIKYIRVSLHFYNFIYKQLANERSVILVCIKGVYCENDTLGIARGSGEYGNLFLTQNFFFLKDICDFTCNFAIVRKSYNYFINFFKFYSVAGTSFHLRERVCKQRE